MQRKRKITVAIVVVALVSIYPAYLIAYMIDEARWWNVGRPRLVNELAAEDMLVMFINNGFDDVFYGYREAENIAKGSDLGREWIVADMPELGNEIRGLIVSPDDPDSAVAFVIDLRRNLSAIVLSDNTATRYETAEGLLFTLQAISPQAADEVADRIGKAE